MNRLWETNIGKLVVGGCGTQVGLLFTCGTLTTALLFCAVCAAANVLTVGVSQEVVFVSPEPTKTRVVTPTATPTSAVVESLLGQVQLLSGEVEFLRSNMNVPVAVLPTATPTATPIPFLVANQSAVTMRSGPGTEYNEVGILAYNDSAEIVGRDQLTNWWLVAAADGQFAWVAANLVSGNFVSNDIPVVTVPSLMAGGTPGAAPDGFSPPVSNGAVTAVTPQLLVPQGTPTASAGNQRQFVQEMPAYQRFKGHLLIPPVSESVSPHGDRIAITERIKLYTVTTDGALTHIWLEEDSEIGPIGNVVWSPDGDYLAFVVGYKAKYCKPCEGIAILRLADGLITYLEHPGDLDLQAPRWTQDGKLLVNAHPGEPADGVAYEYTLSGKGKLAAGAYVLSASHEGQRWYPWIPGKTWLVGTTERADSYNAD